jgi:hypothetical protein
MDGEALAAPVGAGLLQGLGIGGVGRLQAGSIGEILLGFVDEDCVIHGKKEGADVPTAEGVHRHDEWDATRSTHRGRRAPAAGFTSWAGWWHRTGSPAAPPP